MRALHACDHSASISRYLYACGLYQHVYYGCWCNRHPQNLGYPLVNMHCMQTTVRMHVDSLNKSWPIADNGMLLVCCSDGKKGAFRLHPTLQAQLRASLANG